MMPQPPQYIDCRRCNCYFYPYPISPNATVRCPNCNTSNPLPVARPPPPPPPTLYPLSPQFGSLFLEDFDFVSTIDRYEPHPTPAATSSINSLKARKVTKHDLNNTESSSCVICYDEFGMKEESVNQMPCCGHWFHSECIVKWLHLKNTCPLCRHEFPREANSMLRSPVPPEGVITMMSDVSPVSEALPTEVEIGWFNVMSFVDSLPLFL